MLAERGRTADGALASPACYTAGTEEVLMMRAWRWAVACLVLSACGESDTKPAAPELVSEIAPGSQGSNPSHIVASGGTLFFAADDGTSGVELWKSDGTAKGTMLVRDIAGGSASSTPHELTVVGSSVFFVADDGVRGAELWVSDGTSAGTRLVQDLLPGTRSSDPSGLVASGGMCLFSASHPTAGIEPWRSDGTASGTYLLADVNPGASSSFPRSFATGQGAAWFATLSSVPVGDGSLDQWLIARVHRTDGTTGGTNIAYENRVRQPSWAGAWDWIDLVRSVGPRMTFFEQNDLFAIESNGAVTKAHSFPGAGDAHSQMSGVGLPAVSGATMYVPGRQSYAGLFTLFESDGTSDGTKTLGGDLGMDYSRLTVVVAGRRAFLRSGAGPELWTSTGAAPTRLSTVIPDFGTGRGFFSQGATAGDPVRYVDDGGRLLFSGDDGKTGRELWESDGSPSGTKLSADIAKGAASSDPAEMVVIGSRVCFSAWEESHGRELWCQERK